MPDVNSNAPVVTSTWVALDVHKNSITAATFAEASGEIAVTQLEHCEKAIRRFLKRLGAPGSLAVCYEAGPCGYELYRLLLRLGVACDIVAPSLTPVRPGDRVKTDKRDARRLVCLYRAGQLGFVRPPTPEQEGLRDLLRCRDDLRVARTAARHRVAKQLLRHGRVFREGKKAWTLKHRAWVAAQRLEDANAQAALEQMRLHLAGLDAQIAALDRQLEQIARSDPWSELAAWLCCFRGIATLTALGLLAEIGDFRRFGNARELMSFLGLTACEYSSGEKRRRGSITKTGNRHARRLVVEAAWHYQHPPRLSARIRSNGELVPAETLARAWQAQIRLHERHRHLTRNGKLPVVATVAVARELCGFLWAAMTSQPLDEEVRQAA
jgi:transposase